MIRRYLCVVIFMSCYGLAANAQVASPSLNPISNTPFASNAWVRSFSMVSMGINNGFTGTVSNNSGLSSETTSTASTPGFAAEYRGMRWTFGGSAMGQLRTYWILDGPVNDIESEATVSANSVAAAYRLSDAFALGLGYVEFDQRIRNDVLDNSGNTLNSSNTTMEDSQITGSVSWRLGESIYLGGALTNVTNNQGSTVVKNTYLRTTVGLGVLFGRPGETQIRAEYQLASSPDQVAPAAGGKDENVHDRTSHRTTNLEVLFGQIYLGYQNASLVIGDSKITNTTTTYGIGWIPFNGFTVHIGPEERQTVAFPDQPTGINESDSAWKLQVGWVF